MLDMNSMKRGDLDEEFLDNPRDVDMESFHMEQTPCRVLFGNCKGETHTPHSGFKQLYRRLRSHYKPEKLSSKEESISSAVLTGVSILVLGCPTEKFSKAECEAIRKFILNGGSLFICMAEKGNKVSQTNINYILEEFGIVVNSDAVVRTVHHRYMHPKEVLITDGVLNREIHEAIFRSSQPVTFSPDSFAYGDTMRNFDESFNKLEIVYPHGSTLSIQKPAVALLSSGKIAYPMNRPVAAVWSQPGGGKVAVTGSVQMFDDKWIDKENNAQLMDFIFSYLRNDSEIQLNHIDADEPDLNDYQHIPDIGSLSERPKSCLQDIGEELPRDFKQLFEEEVFCDKEDVIAEATALFKKLNTKTGPLTLIPPKFEVPLPSLQPAVFPPTFREPPPPALELFDLDETFASPQSCLAQLAHKCGDGSEEDVACFIIESARILGIRETQGGKQVTSKTSAKALLTEIFARTIEYKMSGSGDRSEFHGMPDFGNDTMTLL
ncbi:putative intraflagellar transport protein [Chloropicon primus]|uniref:Putative intraflagellar transport protein n=1 Tax=Chloropicon primus TaxID=1764295 RepID=A0A5B8MCW3_9CHLO|nr:putative intraflagellar transport protein [Chloropicon primus]|eukprot:QDZ17934.1 putative intraflagellar transport protein [Chloropicon primus]